MGKVLHVISPLPWISQQFAQYGAGSLHGWTIRPHDGLIPLEHIGRDDALWIAPGLLIALNDWNERHGKETLYLQAPAKDWLSRLPHKMLGRRTLLAEVGDIRDWDSLPAALGPKPWSQICQGRVEGFRAARRGMQALQEALARAPDKSVIEFNGHVGSISQEWYVVIGQDAVVASSGYCLHAPSDSHHILTVFDGAVFNEEYREAAQRLAEQVRQLTGISNVGLLIAFRSSPADGVILEADPLWSLAPYPFGPSGMEALVEAIADSRLRPKLPVPASTSGQFGGASDERRRASPGSDLTFLSGTGRAMDKQSIYVPDLWMVERFQARYRSFTPIPPSPGR